VGRCDDDDTGGTEANQQQQCDTTTNILEKHNERVGLRRVVQSEQGDGRDRCCACRMTASAATTSTVRN